MNINYTVADHERTLTARTSIIITAATRFEVTFLPLHTTAAAGILVNTPIENAISCFYSRCTHSRQGQPKLFGRGRCLFSVRSDFFAGTKNDFRSAAVCVLAWPAVWAKRSFFRNFSIQIVDMCSLTKVV